MTTLIAPYTNYRLTAPKETRHGEFFPLVTELDEYFIAEDGSFIVLENSTSNPPLRLTATSANYSLTALSTDHSLTAPVSNYSLTAPTGD